MPPIQCAAIRLTRRRPALRSAPPNAGPVEQEPEAGNERGAMIIDCHGHYTTEPQKLHDFRKNQIAAIKDPSQKPSAAALKISDDEIRESVEGAQLKLQRERGTDLTIFSPRASGMAHHIGDAGDEPRVVAGLQRADPPRRTALSRAISSASASCRSRRACRPKNCVGELERCVNEFGFVGCNLNPDPSGGHWNAPPLDRPLVVSALREDGGARRAGDGACQRLLQSRNCPHHRRALHQRRHHRLHAVHHLGSVQGFPDAASSSFRMAAARCPTTGAAIAASRRT